MPPIYYGCLDRCQPSGVQRTAYIDKLLIELIRQRIVSVFQKPKFSGNPDEVFEKFKEIEALQERRLHLLDKFHYASYKRDIVIAELNEVESKLRELEKALENYFISHPDDNPILSTIFETPAEKLGEFEISFRRMLVKTIVWRLRYFADFIVVSFQPLTPDELEQRDSKRLVSYISLRYSERTRTESASIE